MQKPLRAPIQADGKRGKNGRGTLDSYEAIWVGSDSVIDRGLDGDRSDTNFIVFSAGEISASRSYGEKPRRAIKSEER